MKIYIDKPILLAVTGPINSGKRAYVDFISKRLNCTHVYSLSAFAAYEAKKFFDHGINTENKAEIREYMNIMRHMKGDSYFIKQLGLEEIVNYSVVFVRSLKNVEEIKYFQSIGGIVVGITADQEIRYRRSQQEESLRGFSFEYFKEFEATEFPELDRCYQLANIQIRNDDFDFKKEPSKFYLGPCSDMLNDLARKFPQFDSDKNDYDPMYIKLVDDEEKRAVKTLLA
ncbi:MAG: hypothetical protein ACR2IQ_00975 [Minisyncoccia bacterium]